jgi:hypothetical protein
MYWLEWHDCQWHHHKMRKLLNIFCLLIIVAACSGVSEQNIDLSSSEKERLHNEYGQLIERLSSEIQGKRAKPLLCMDINHLKQIAVKLDRSLAAANGNSDELYSAPLKQSAVREYCQFNQQTKNLELNSQLRAQNQLLQARNQWRRLNQ